MRVGLVVVSMSILANATGALASQWITPDARSMAMGGAFVGVAEGPLSGYWNPGGLGREGKHFGASVPFAFRAEVIGDMFSAANDLHQEAQDCEAGRCDVVALERAIDRMDQPGNGILADGALSVAARYRGVGLFVHSLAEAGGSPDVDRVRITPLSFRNNQSKVVVQGLHATEIGAAYGRELFGSGVFVGGALKAIVGRVGYSEILLVQDDPELDDVVQDFDEDSEVSVQPGVDLSALWEVDRVFPMPFSPRAGVAVRNLNGPSFDQPSKGRQAGESDVDLDPQARVGFALDPLPFWTVALDVDLTDNDTLVDGFSSRFLAVGTEVNVVNRDELNIPLRVGLSKNLAESDSDLAFTFGGGVRFFSVALDLAGQISSQQEPLEEHSTSEVPTNFAFGAQLSAEF